MSRTDITAINAKTISINGSPIAGSAAPVGLVTTFDQLDADVVLALNGAVIQGTFSPGMTFTNFDNVNVLSGVSLGDAVKYGMASTPASSASSGPIYSFPGGGVTPTPTPAPTLSQPSISPASGTVGQTFTATDGVVTNGTLTGRRWLLAGTAIGTGTTVTPNSAGTLTLENTALGTNGATITNTSGGVAVAAAVNALKIAFAGSSTYEKYSTDGSGTTVSNATRSTDGVTFSPMGTQGSALLAYAGIVANRTGLATQYLMRGRGGTTVANDWLPAGSGDRANLVNAIKAMGGVDVLNWACGFNDAFQNILVSEAQHLANLRQLFALIRSETGLPNLKITVGISQLYTGTDTTVAPDAKWTALRSAEMTVAQDANNYFSAQWYDLPQGDGIHMTGPAFLVHAARIAENGLAALGLGGAVAETGPRITAAAAIYNTKTRVTITHNRGTDFTPTTGLSGFLVSFDNGSTYLTPSAAVRVDATHVDLTHAASGGVAPIVYDFLGKAANVSAVLKDNSPRNLPLNPSYTAGVAAPSGTTTVDPGAATPAPAFTTQPSVSPSSGTAGTTTYTATPGTVSNGSVASRAWQLNGTTISTGLTAAPAAAGTLTYQETATGAGGTTLSAVQTATVVAASGGANKTAKVAFSKALPAPTGFNAFNDSGSIVQNSNAGLTKTLADTTGAATGWTLTTTVFNSGNDTQGTTTGANTGVYPDAAMVGYWYNGNTANGDNGGVTTTSTTLSLTGLNPAKRYTFKVFGGRAASDRKVTYTAGGTTQTIDAGNNTTITATFATLTPDANGLLTLQFMPAAGYGFGYINVLEITETTP